MPQARDEAGNVWEVDAQGNPVALVQAAPQGAAVAPNPTAQYEAPQAASAVAQTRAQTDKTRTDIVDTTADNERADAQLVAELFGKGLRLTGRTDPNTGKPEVERIPGWTPQGEDSSKAESDKAVAARRILQMLDGEGGISAQFDESFANQGVASLNEFNPLRGENQKFDVKANAMLPFAKKLLRTPGEGSQSDKEAQDYRDQLPRASFRDETNVQLMNDLRVTALSVLENEGVDVTRYNQATGLIPKTPSAPKAAGAGATEARGELPEGFQGGFRELVDGLQSGQFTPEQFAAFRVKQDQDAFGGEAKDQYYTYLEDGYQLQEAFNAGASAADVPDVGAPTRELSGFDQSLNNIAVHPAFTGLANTVDSAFLGSVSSFAGDQMKAGNNVNPGYALGGQMLGAIGGTTALAKGAGKIASKVAPNLLGGGGKAQLARNVGTDAAYGTAYGMNTGQDFSDAALASAVGSVGGNLAGKALGKAVGGANLDPAVQYLRNRKIPLTTGQTLGGVAKGVEDRMAGLPFVGDQVGARRLEGLQTFNREAFDEAGSPIGFQSRRVGGEGAADLGDAVSSAYDNTLAGLDAPLDARFLADTSAAVAPLQKLPADIRRPMGQVMDARIQPIADAGRLTGPDYQAARSTLKKTRNKVPTKFEGFDPEYQQAATDLIGALDGQVSRGAGQDVVQGLENANQANRLSKIVQDATERAKGGSQSGEVRTFTPSQLQFANQASARKFPGANPLTELADQGQRVLPSQIPDSGTAGRLATLALPGAALGGGAGLGALADGQDGAQTGAATSAAMASALMLLGTKGGQKGLNGLLATRPDIVKELGGMIQRRSGLFGSASVPLALNAQQ